MSKWFGAIAGNVESLLDKVDQVAGQALQKDASPDLNDKEKIQSQQSQWQSSGSMPTSAYSPFLSGSGGKIQPAPERRNQSEEKRSSPLNASRNADRSSKTLVTS